MPMSSHFHHLLVPVDFSDADEPLLKVVLAMAASNQARVTLLHVIESLEAEEGEADEELDEFFAALESQAQSRLDDISQRFRKGGLVVEQEIVFGHRAREIVRFSSAGNADLVVLRAQRADLADPHAAWSTLGHQLTVLCQCPVLLLK